MFYNCLGVRKSRAAFFLTLSVDLCLLCQLTELDLEVRISWQVVAPHVAVHISQQASVQSALLFAHDTGRNEIIRSLPKSIYTLSSCACNSGCFFPCSHFAQKFRFPMYNFKINFFSDDDDDGDDGDDDDDDADDHNDDSDDDGDDDDGDDDDDADDHNDDSDDDGDDAVDDDDDVKGYLGCS